MALLIKQLILLTILAITCLPGISTGSVPVPIDSVDYSRIKHKKVRKLIAMQKQFGVNNFDEIHPVCYNTLDSNSFRTFKKSQIIRQDISVVWNNLIHQSLNEEFDGRIVTFGLLYSKKCQNLFYKNEPTTGIEEGQVLFFNLRMLKGIKNLAVALEVTRMDNENKTVEYCYVDHGDTRGTQQFILIPTREGFTEICQITKYRCKSRLRDRRLYSFFHERIIKEMFNSIKNKSERNTPTLLLSLIPTNTIE